MSEPKRFNYGILIASDSRSTGENKDYCSDVIQQTMPEEHYQFSFQTIVPDNIDELKKAMIELADVHQLHLVITSGGTGFAPRDNTPEATKAVIHKEAMGLSIAMSLSSREKTPMWMLSRYVCGIRNQTLIVNLPGSPKAVKECLEAILPALYHGLEVLNKVVQQHTIKEEKS